ncbi:hypothetical protein BU15DRAFT_79555 [Melanogaster broomeanus]|nr:hypothetical protein BU15DRAFT_79555 [Melanogaster broomeanus]
MDPSSQKRTKYLPHKWTYRLTNGLVTSKTDPSHVDSGPATASKTDGLPWAILPVFSPAAAPTAPICFDPARVFLAPPCIFTTTLAPPPVVDFARAFSAARCPPVVVPAGAFLVSPIHFSPIYAEHPKDPVEHLRVPTPLSATLAPPGANALGSGKNSVAIRAMRSVRSLARIGSWAQLKNTPNPDEVDAPTKDKDSEAKKKKKKKDKDKAKETNRCSGSSFEAGALTASPARSKIDSKSLVGLPSTMRLPSSRSGSTASSVVAANTMSSRLSVDSANVLGGGILARGRSGSNMSTASSLRPMSTSSCISVFDLARTFLVPSAFSATPTAPARAKERDMLGIPNLIELC